MPPVELVMPPPPDMEIVTVGAEVGAGSTSSRLRESLLCAYTLKADAYTANKTSAAAKAPTVTENVFVIVFCIVFTGNRPSREPSSFFKALDVTEGKEGSPEGGMEQALHPDHPERTTEQTRTRVVRGQAQC